jgi:hypothetical protein
MHSLTASPHKQAAINIPKPPPGGAFPASRGVILGVFRVISGVSAAKYVTDPTKF